MKKKIAAFTLLLLTAFCGEKYNFTNYPLGTDFLIETETGVGQNFSEISSGSNLVFFGFTSCPDVCPMGLTRMVNAFKNTPATDMPGLFFVTVDPERDTHEKIQAYLSTSFQSVKGIRLEKNSAAFTLKKFGVGVSKKTKGKQIEIEHSSYIFLTDKNGSVKYLIKSEVKSEQIRQIVKAYQKSIRN